ncbi:uncharacterized protein [Euphorbia lathyris]|uniref:uncharacterized protein n=1 Tax=Euphorbia lathyris TaxID=212925 RepID=UPI0033137C4E
MEMFLLHDTKENDQECEISFLPTFLEKNLDNNVFFGAPKFVEIPDGLYCLTCYNFHGYPSRELTTNETEYFLFLLVNCPCNCASIEYPREYMLGSYDHLHQHFNELRRKFNSFEDLTTKIIFFNEKSWKLVRESDTKKDNMMAGPIIDMLMELPEGILEDYKTSFHEFLKKIYKERIGFVKGRYLVISTEVLFRQCLGNTVLFLEILSEAYALVESQYCSISRFAIESGFWQVCPEFGGFFWRNNNLEKDFPFLRKFMQEKRNVFVKNFSLSMGPYYLIGGGYFSYIENIRGDLIFWYIPNFWQEAFRHEENACDYNAENFWYGWCGRNKLKYGCPYNGVTVNECDYKMMLEFFPRAILNY